MTDADFGNDHESRAVTHLFTRIEIIAIDLAVRDCVAKASDVSDHLHQRAGVRCNACTNAQRSQERLKFRRANASRSGKRAPRSCLAAFEPLQASISFEDDPRIVFEPPRSA